MKIKLKKNSLLRKIILVAIFLIVVLYIFRYAAYFKRENNDNMLVSIQNLTNVELAHDVYIDENEVIYFSENDVREYLNQDLYYEKNDNNMRRFISISQNKILDITEGQNHMFVNGNREKIKGSVIEREGIYYFPISELEKVYNIEVEYLKDVNRLNIEKLSEEKIKAVVNRDTDLKYKMTNISKTLQTLEQGENVTIVQYMNNEWVKIKTDDYMVGYVKKSKLINIENERYNLAQNDYDNFDIEKSEIVEINDSAYEDFNQRIVKYDGRQEIIKNIMDKVSSQILKQPDYVGIKVDISSIDNAENYYRFLKELKAEANDLGAGVIVKNQSNLDKNELKKSANIVL